MANLETISLRDLIRSRDLGRRDLLTHEQWNNGQLIDNTKPMCDSIQTPSRALLQFAFGLMLSYHSITHHPRAMQRSAHYMEQHSPETDSLGYLTVYRMGSHTLYDAPDQVFFSTDYAHISMMCSIM